MPVTAEYVARETVSNLWRNRLMTVAAVLTVAVSLSLVGAALLLKQGAAQATGVWQRGTEVLIFMKPTASQSEIHAVGAELTTLSYVEQPPAYWSQQKDFTEAKRTVPYWTESGVTIAGTPSSWRVTPTHLQDAAELVTKFKRQPGVDHVVTPNAQIRTEEIVINVLQWVFIVVALVLLISASVLILNTIRMAIFARRREVSVMKLVGATNWFIRLPFMSEGLLQGLAGSLIAASLVYGLHLLLDHLGSPGSPLAEMRLSGFQTLMTDLVVVIVGAGVGTAGSAVAIRRFLDV